MELIGICIVGKIWLLKIGEIPMQLPVAILLVSETLTRIHAHCNPLYSLHQLYSVHLLYTVYGHPGFTMYTVQCTVYIVNPRMCYPGCATLDVLPWMCYPGCATLDVLPLMCYPGCIPWMLSLLFTNIFLFGHTLHK